jgi:hypothetical protein
MVKILVLVLLVGVLVSLFSGLFFMNRDQGNSRRMLTALTIRISLSVLLFLVLFLAWRTGAIQPHGLLSR